MKSYLPLLFFLLLGLGLQAQSPRFEKGAGKKPDREEPVHERQKLPEPKTQQKDEPLRWQDKLVFGGGAGLNFGTNTNIFVAPQVGYKITDNLVAGAGYLYNYARFSQVWTGFGWVPLDEPIENTIHGPHLFANFQLMESLFLGAQPEYLNHDALLINTFGNVYSENRWTPVLWVQAGFLTKIGKKGFTQIGMRYNLLHDQYSPYATSWSPIFQFFF